MKQLLLYTLLLFLPGSCIKLTDPLHHARIDVVETEMAELSKEPPVVIKDSLKILNYWKQFRQLLINNDTAALMRQSVQYVYCPVYNEAYNYYSGNKLVPIYAFLNAPYRDKYIAAFSPYLSKDTPDIFISKSDSREMENFGIRQQEQALHYTLNFLTRQTCNNYTITRTHSFYFIKVDDSLKFAGLSVDENGSRYLYKLMPSDSLYFPLFRNGQDANTNINALDTFRNRYYSKYLLQFKEPNLYTDKSEDEMFRFTWIRSFHLPVVIRLQKHNDNYMLYTKEMIPNNGYTLPEIIVNTEKKLSAFEWYNLNQKLNDLDFWKLISNDPAPTPHDGAEWILEGKTKDRYHFTTRNSPDDKTYRACCKYLLSLTTLKIPEKDQY